MAFNKIIAALRDPAFLRFLATGIVNTGFSYGMFAVLVLAGLHFAVANLLALIAGIAFSYVTVGVFVFGKLGWGRLLPYAGFWLVMYFAGTGIIGATVALGGSALLGGAVSTSLLVPIAFFAQKQVIFR